MRLQAGDTKCAGELLGENWGDTDHVCERREFCLRHLAFVAEHNMRVDRINHTGWACSDDGYEFYMPVEEQKELPL